MANPSPETRKTGNVLKWVAIGCGGAVLLCVGLGIALFFWIKQSINLSFDTQQAEQTARQIMDYEIPGGSQGVVSTSFAGIEFAGVASANDPQGTLLFVGRLPANGEADPAQLQESLQQAIEQQLGDTFTVTSQRTESKQLCGQAVNVEVLQGEQTTNGQPIPALSYQTFVNYNADIVFVSLTTTGDDAQATAEQIFGSLACQPR